MGYRTTKTSKGLIVHDVEIASDVARKGKPAITKVELLKAKDMFYSEKAAGRAPRLWFEHTDKAGVLEIGTLDNVDVKPVRGKDWLTGDLFITEPSYIAKFERGELRSRSPEITIALDLSTVKLDGLSLLPREGHFDSQLPDLVPEGAELVLCAATEQDGHLKLRYEDADMDIKDQLIAAQAENAALKIRLAQNEDPEVTNVVEKLKSEHELASLKLAAEKDEALTKLNAQIDVERKVNDLKANGCALTAAQIRLKLSKCDSAGARTAVYETLRFVKTGGIKLEIDPSEVPENEKLRFELVEGFKAFKQSYPKTKFTEETWCALHLTPKQDLSGKQVTEVK